MIDFKHLLITIPHSQTKIPREISMSNINPKCKDDMTFSVDVDTNTIYDFTHSIGNSQIVFPYHRSLVDVNCDSKNLDESVPITSWFDKKLYIKNSSEQVRKKLIEWYHHPYHNKIKNIEKFFILDCHSTSEGDEDPYGDRFEGDIVLNDTQYYKNRLVTYCYRDITETYANHLSHLLPKCKIKINTKYMTKTFGYTMGYHGLNGISNVQVPCITQEINEALYTSGRDQKFDTYKGIELNRIFAECLKKTLIKFEDKLLK